eukprot:TRINITY_DN13568_c0_g2_i2.p1 TRINITY_DN13568_c0_g2~~TRINITY_DN13568_c0_g2_i2.p1  ORF type:complete len:482 (+),score=105.42 TRINITY_DN13568_c0_g2_i2:220-1665(+)
MQPAFMGPGVVHALPGLLNATSNCWPMIMISSAPYASQNSRGSFQEAPQLEAAKIYSKYASHVQSVRDFEYFLHTSLRHATYGRPGAVYLEITREVIESQAIEQVDTLAGIKPPPKVCPDVFHVEEALELLLKAERPLIIIGKGAAYSRAEEELLKFVEYFGVPFLPSPMGKGLISDNHPLCVGAARSLALAEADTVVLIGVRMNWMFNFGNGFAKDVKIVQVDVSPEEFYNNVKATVTLQGDAKVVVHQLLYHALERKIDSRNFYKSWISKLGEKVIQNGKLLEKKMIDNSSPMKYHYVLKTINQFLPRDAILVNEGANTMDIGRVIFMHEFPRCRLDAGTLGTMGIGVGYAIAAAVAFPNRKVVTVQGDSAFGFSAMEVEVACRYKLPITFIVLNNNGIYRGVEALSTVDPTLVPPTVLTPGTRYEKIIEAFGGVGFYCESPEELPNIVSSALLSPLPSLLNVKIDPYGPIPTIVQKKH